MLLSDRDIKAELDSGRIGLDPYEPAMIQPSSIDVRLDRFFRLFDNHKYPFIDPAEDQPDLTRLVEAAPEQPFILVRVQAPAGSNNLFQTALIELAPFDQVLPRRAVRGSLGSL